MLCDDRAVAPHDDAIGVSSQLGGAPRRFRCDAVAIVIQAHQAALRHRDFHLVVAVEGTAVRDQALPLGLEDLPDGLVALLGMRVLPCLSQAARLQPGVELVIIGKVQPGREQMLAQIADLVLDLPLLPTRSRLARRGWVTARRR